MVQKQISHSLVKERTFKTGNLKRSQSTKLIQVGIKRTGKRRSKLRITFLLIISTLVSNYLLAQEDVFNYIFTQDFESTTTGYYARGEWSRDWNSPPWENGLDRTQILNEEGSRVMKFNYPQGTYAPDNGGAQWLSNFGPGYEEVYFSYNVMFRPGFEWVLGGKLPGLGGGNNPAGGADMFWDSGFSIRIMWNKDGGSDGTLFFYVYHQDKPTKYGDTFQFPYTPLSVTGEIWHNLTMRVVLNSIDPNRAVSDPANAGNKDGLVEFFLDGRLVFSKTGLRFRNLSSIWIDTQHVTGYFGGSDQTWASVRDEWMLFDDFVVYTYSDQMSVPRGRTPSSPGRVIQLPNLKDQSTNPPIPTDSTDNEPPAIPAGLSAAELTSESVTFRWDPVTDNVGVTGFRVFLDGAEYGTTGNRYYTIRGLEPGSSHDIAVSAYDANGNESGLSAPLTITTTSESDNQPPVTPTGLQILESSFNSMVIGWDRSTDNVAVEGYNIYLDGSKLASTGNTTYTIQGLEAARQYTVSVSAYDPTGNESPQSTVLTITTPAEPDTQPPSTPEGLEVLDSSSNSLIITWEPAADNVGVEGYYIFLDGSKLGSTDNTMYPIVNLQPATEYSLSVSAHDAASNESPRTSPVTARTLEQDTIPPTVPVGLTPTIVTESSIALMWQESEDNVRVSGYSIFVNGVKKGTSETNGHNLRDLSPGIDYTISVSAFDASANESVPSSGLQTNTKRPGELSVPTLPAVSVVALNKSPSSAAVVSTIDSHGFVEIEEYGVKVEKSNADNQAGEWIYAEPGASHLNCSGREEEGLQLLYDFACGNGNQIRDASGNDEPINLSISDPVATAWMPGQGLQILGETVVSSNDQSGRLSEALYTERELTMEAWIKPAQIFQSEPVPIITLTGEDSKRSLTLMHAGNQAYFEYSVVFSDEEQPDFDEELVTDEKFINLTLQHVVFTQNKAGNATFYINGVEVYSGSFERTPFQLGENLNVLLSGTSGGAEPWYGTYYMVAFYNRALEKGEVLKNHQSGYGEIEFITDILVESNTPYDITPFVKTNHGFVYGKSKSLLIENVLTADNTDSLYMAIYPNPSDGNFRVHIENLPADQSVLMVTDLSGQTLFTREINVDGEQEHYDEEILLSGILPEGLYSLILVSGDKAVARKLVVY
jgi:chitodextrinase